MPQPVYVHKLALFYERSVSDIDDTGQSAAEVRQRNSGFSEIRGAVFQLCILYAKKRKP